MNTILVFLSLFAGPSDAKLEQLVSANESAVGLIHTLDMTIEQHSISKNGQPTNIHKATHFWTKDGRVERQRYIDRTAQPLQDRGDLIEDGKEIKVLLNYDWENPPSLHPRQQGAVKAWFGPQEGIAPPKFLNPSGQFAMLHIQINLQDTRRSLRELVRQSPEATVVGETKIAGYRVWHIRALHPDTKTDGAFANCRLDVYLDPAVNYMARKVRIAMPDTDPAPDSVAPLDYEREAIKFHDAGDGAFIPTEVITRMYTPAFGKGPVSEGRWVATEVSVNKALPDDALAFAWPENALVMQEPPVGNTRRVQLWGPNNQPAKEITSVADLPLPPDMMPAESGLFTPLRIFLIALGVLGLAILYLVFIRK